MFPEAACKTMQSILGDAGHSSEEVLEVKGHITFPTLDMVWVIGFDTAHMFTTQRVGGFSLS